jgi:hypothetical protein
VLDVVVIGAGAAGLAVAIFAARELPGRRIVLLDGARSLGAKILLSGGGRCNVTNREVSERDYCGGRAPVIRRILRALPVPETLAFFEGVGVPLHEESLGKMFPDTNRARTVLEALVGECRACGVEIRNGQRVEHVARSSNGLAVTTAAGTMAARRVVLATGGLSLPKSGSDGAGYRFAQALGHAVVPTTAALVPLLTGDALHEDLGGVSVPVEILLNARHARLCRVRGDLLWTHFGVSGPAVLDASRHWLRARLEDRAPQVHVSFTPGDDFPSVDAWLIALGAARPRRQVDSVLSQRLPAALGRALLRQSGVPADAALHSLSRDARRRLVHRLTAWPLPVVDSRGYDHAEVTAGGVSLDEIDPATMQSRVCPGLFLVGEILDVDGRLGGFNFQWAWASARAAARGLAATLERDELPVSG